MDSAHIIDVTDAEFDDQVVVRSHEVPVIVDFWAPWCAPCRMLGPVLEREIAQLGGRAVLAKINTDENPEVATRYRISGIPAVKAFRGGEVVAEFVGAQPPQVVREWLAKLTPSEARQAIEAAEKALEADDLEGAEKILRGLLGNEEVGGKAALLLAAVEVDLGRTEELEALLARVPPRELDDEIADGLRLRAQLVADAKAYGGEEAARAAVAKDAGDLDARWALAASLAAKRDVAGALESFLEIVGRSRKYKDDAARKAMLAIFQQLGPDDDIAREYRRRLQVIL